MKINTTTIGAEQVEILLNLEETHFVDLKGVDISPASLTKTLSAFANTSGGEVYIGIDEVVGADGTKRIWRGFEDQEAANAILQTVEAMSPLSNHYEAIFLSCDGCTGLVLQLTILKSRDILYASNGKAYVRRGAQKLPVEGDEALRKLMSIGIEN